MFGGAWCWLMLAAVCSAEKWQFPDAASSARIDRKLSFNDNSAAPTRDAFKKNVQSDHILFREPAESQGYYDQPINSVRPTQVRPNEIDNSIGYPDDNNQLSKYPAQHTSDENQVYESDGTLDTVQTCTCTQNCAHSVHNSGDCGQNCCHFNAAPPKSEYFHDLIDERPMLLPGRSPSGGPFPPPPDSVMNGQYGSAHALESAIMSGFEQRPPLPILIGPQGPNEVFGPTPNSKVTPVLVGPTGPTGIIGPTKKPTFSGVGPNINHHIIRNDYNGRPVLIGPNGPTRTVRPDTISALVGSERPTGFVGPNKRPGDYHGGRPVLVGPDGPTGTIGPGKEPSHVGSERHGQRPVLLSPEGPATIGANKLPALIATSKPTVFLGHHHRPSGYFSGRPILVGPEPSGVIRPNKPSYLIGANGPTGVVGSFLKPAENFYAKSKRIGLEGPTATMEPKYEDVFSFFKNQEEVKASESAQRPVLVGPDGPTGIIGPGYNQRPILVGPGGPTGIIGPRRPVLVGPRGPTGVIGPGYGLSGQGPRRPVLVGPGGPTGVIGPYGFYGK